MVESEATCTENGTRVRVCECGEQDSEAISPNGHTDGEWITDAEPTCTEEGSKHQICSICEETIKTESIAATGHTDGEWIIDARATCVEDGQRHQVCAVCAEVLKTETLEATGKHVYVGRTTTEATCTEKGVKTYTCSVCKDTYTKNTEALGHTQVTTPSREANCTQTGLSVGKYCSTCGQVFVAQKETPMTEHNTQYGTCTVCGTVTDAHNALASFIVNNGTLVLYHQSDLSGRISARCGTVLRFNRPYPYGISPFRGGRYGDAYDACYAQKE